MPSGSNFTHQTYTSAVARDESVSRLMATLTLEQKIGQLVMAGFPGPAADADITRLITERRLGGVILFARNCASPEEVRRLCQHLQSLSALPLFIAVDQEGSIVARLQAPVTVFPSNMALGATRSAAVDVLFGQARPAGNLPVTLPGMYALGNGMPDA